MNRLVLIGLWMGVLVGQVPASSHFVTPYMGVSQFGDEIAVGTDATAGVGYTYAVDSEWLLHNRVAAFRYQSNRKNKTLWTYGLGFTRAFDLNFEDYRFLLTAGAMGTFSKDFPGVYPEFGIGLDKALSASQRGFAQFRIGQETGVYLGLMVDLFPDPPLYVAPTDDAVEPTVVGTLAMTGPDTLLSLAIRSRKLDDIAASPVRNEIQQAVDYGVIESDFEYFEPWRLVTWFNAKKSIENAYYYRQLIAKTKKPFAFEVTGPKSWVRYVDIYVASYRGDVVKTLATQKAYEPGHYGFLWNGSTDYDDYVRGGEYTVHVQVSDEETLLYESQTTVNVSVISQDDLMAAYAVNWELILEKSDISTDLDLHIKPIRKIDLYVELGRILVAMGYKPDNGESIRDYGDLKGLSDADELYLSAALVALGDLGASTTAFYPNQLITRADQALVLARFMNLED